MLNTALHLVSSAEIIISKVLLNQTKRHETHTQCSLTYTISLCSRGHGYLPPLHSKWLILHPHRVDMAMEYIWNMALTVEKCASRLAMHISRKEQKAWMISALNKWGVNINPDSLQEHRPICAEWLSPVTESRAPHMLKLTAVSSYYMKYNCCALASHSATQPLWIIYIELFLLSVFKESYQKLRCPLPRWWMEASFQSLSSFWFVYYLF